MPEQSVAAEIMRAVDAGFEEQLQLSQELVRFVVSTLWI